jgi:hypothetical protein
MLLLILGAAAIWVLLSVAVALALGRMVKVADTAEADARFARALTRQLVDSRSAQFEQAAPLRRAS